MFTYQEMIEHLLKITRNGHNNISYAAFTNNSDLLAACKPYTDDIGAEIYGYACAQNNEKVQQYLHDFDIHMAKVIQGYATCDDLADLYQQMPVQTFKNALLEGFAQANKVAKVTQMLNRAAHTSDIHYGNYFQSTIKGYASKNHATELLELITGTNQFPIAIFEAARNGHEDLVERLLRAQPLLRSQAIEGYCKGRHYHALSQFLESSADIGLVISALLGKQLCKASLLLLLIHTDDEKLFDNIISAIQTYSSVNSELSITRSDVNNIKNIQKSMSSSNLNVIEAILENALINLLPEKQEAELLKQLCWFAFPTQHYSRTATP